MADSNYQEFRRKLKPLSEEAKMARKPLPPDVLAGALQDRVHKKYRRDDMPLFMCDECGCVDNTALSPSYWRDKHTHRRLLCTECDTGEWHGEFKKKLAKGMLIDQDGHLWLPDKDGNPVGFPENYRITGKVE